LIQALIMVKYLFFKIFL